MVISPASFQSNNLLRNGKVSVGVEFFRSPVYATEIMKIMVTGSSGFLAQHIVPKFQKEGHEVVGVDKRPEITPSDKFLCTDIRDLTFRDLLGIDFVVHLGWRTNIPDCSRHPEESTADNIDVTIHLLEVAKEAGVKKMFLPSTASLYGNNPTPWKEDMLGRPIEHYSWQKLACEFAFKMYAEVLGLNTVIARFFQIFGEYQRDDTALAAVLRQKKRQTHHPDRDDGAVVLPLRPARFHLCGRHSRRGLSARYG